MSLFVGKVGSCFWSYGTGPISTGEWETVLDQIRIMSECNEPDPLVRLTVSYRQASPSYEQRNQLARTLEFYMDKLEDHPGMVLGHAFVTDSKIAAGILAATSWILKRRKPYPERTFTSPRDGLDWLTTLTSKDTPDQAWAEMRRVVPPELFWPQDT